MPGQRKRPREAGPRGRFGQYSSVSIGLGQANLAQPFSYRPTSAAGADCAPVSAATEALTFKPIQEAAATSRAMIACQMKDLESVIGVVSSIPGKPWQRRFRWAAVPISRESRNPPSEERVSCDGRLVAGDGFEPPTFGL